MDIHAIEKLCTQVGAYQLEKQGTVEVEMKGKNDPVTAVDRNSELMLEKGLKEILPEADFRGEERPWSLWEGLCWVVDPLDGTKAYIGAREGWGISIALFDGKDVIFGALYLPQEEGFYYAQKGKGAFKNGQPIHVNPEKQNYAVSSFFKNIELDKTVCDGAAWKCAKVAEGLFGAYPHWAINGKGVKVWDLAAGALIVQESGGYAGHIDGTPFNFYTKDPLIDQSVMANGSETLIKELRTLSPGL